MAVSTSRSVPGTLSVGSRASPPSGPYHILVSEQPVNDAMTMAAVQPDSYFWKLQRNSVYYFLQS